MKNHARATSKHAPSERAPTLVAKLSLCLYRNPRFLSSELIIDAQANIELEIVGGNGSAGSEHLAELGSELIVGVQDLNDALDDDADHGSKKAKPHASAGDADAFAQLTSNDNAIVDVVNSENYKLAKRGNVSDDRFDDELLSLLAGDWTEELVV